MTTGELRRRERELTALVQNWAGAPCAPVVVTARQFLGLVRAHLLQKEVYAAALKRTIHKV